jgi:hypothetical protein
MSIPKIISIPGDMLSMQRRFMLEHLKLPTWRDSLVVPVMDAKTPAVAVSMIGVLALWYR